MKLHVSHNLDDLDLRRSVLALAQTIGAIRADFDEVVDLLKAEPAGPVRLPHEAHLREMVLRLQGRHRKQRQTAARNVHAWLDHHATGGGGPAVQKALPGLHLTAEQIEELRRLIASHWAPQVGAMGPPGLWAIPQVVWTRWAARGIIPASMPIPEIRDSFTAGRLYQVIEEGATYQDMQRLAGQAPLGRPQRLALDFAEAQAAEHMAGFGNRLGGQAAQAALLANRSITRDLIGLYLTGSLKATRAQEGPAHDLTPEERQALSTPKTIETWRSLASELRRQFLHTDPDRDWLRLANTEVVTAHNVGRLHAYQEHGVRRLRAIVQPDACPACRALYLRPDGSPKIFTLDEVMGNYHRTGGMNVGRKASKIGDPDEGWVVNGGVVHPWCRCKLVPVLGTV